MGILAGTEGLYYDSAGRLEGRPLGDGEKGKEKADSSGQTAPFGMTMFRVLAH